MTPLGSCPALLFLLNFAHPKSTIRAYPGFGSYHLTHHNAPRIIELLEHEIRLLDRIERELRPHHTFPKTITFKEITMLSTTGGNTLVYTATLAPAGATFPPDATFTVTSNDPAVLPTVDATGLIVTIPLPSGWVEGTPILSVAYAAVSASNPDWTVTANISPSDPVATRLFCILSMLLLILRTDGPAKWACGVGMS